MTTVADLTTELCVRMGWPTAAGTHRTRALTELNRAHRWIAQQGSFLYLSKRSSLTVLSAASSAAAPADYDYGKAAALVGESGIIEYRELGVFDAVGLRTGGNVFRGNRPAYWTFAMATTTPTIFVKPANTTGGNITYTFTYQRRVDALVDGAGTTALPEGYEDTILLDRAELVAKRLLGIPVTQRFEQELQEQIGTFFSAQRTTKPEAHTDQETEAAKVYETQLKPGV